MMINAAVQSNETWDWSLRKGENMSIIIYTCPKCGKDLQEEMIATYPPIHVKKCYSCGWSSETREDVIRIPYGQDYFSSPVTDKTYIPDSCQSCGNHPNNGGSGVCHCILGNQITY